MRRIAAALIPLILVFALASVGRAEEPAKTDAASLDKGKGVYSAQHCSMCHAIAGKGNPKTPLDDVGAKLKPEEIRKYIVSPKDVKVDSKMRGYPGLPTADLDALVAYLSSLKKK
ncbi:MAG: hypothetical protein DMF50_04645 [Acidobacteria bacterium]|nr:MAG: hypothetical protein DMF50_04645 [Acidobacteriota bacterium]